MSLGRFVEKHLESLRALRDQSAGGRSRRCKMEEALQLGGGVVRPKTQEVRCKMGEEGVSWEAGL